MRRNTGKENLVVSSKIKEYVASKGLRSSGDLPEALSEVIRHKLDKAISRAKSNGRQTIRPEDL